MTSTYCEHCKAWFDEKGKKVEPVLDRSDIVTEEQKKTRKRILG